MSIISPEGSIGVYDLKNQLSAVLEEVLGGREVTVTKHCRPIARIAPITAPGRAERVSAISALHAMGSRVRRNADDARIDDVFATGFALVPELWHAEVANALRSALRAGRIDEPFVREACELLGQLDVRTDVVGSRLQRLALESQAYGLTAYDTCYLLLARDRGLPLVTLYAALAHAAESANVELVL